MVAYYNEFDPYAAQWLRNLIAAGHIAPGEVDERDIRDVQPDDLRGFVQSHFFAGIGGWSLALRLAGWPDDRPVWTGSCPCQPFSAAGKRTRQQDERHLWPHWYGLIRECRPSVVFGEQVASAIAAGWLDDVFHDLEAEGYSCAASVLPACSVGFPHRRDRCWFVAESRYNRTGSENPAANKPTRRQVDTGTESIRLNNRSISSGRTHSRNNGVVADTAESGLPQWGGRSPGEPGPQPEFERLRAMGISDSKRPQRHRGGQRSLSVQEGREDEIRPLGYADGISWIECPDGKARPVKPGIRLLAHGIPGRVGQLRAYGNAIVPQVAAEFIAAYRECVE